ncbi:MAG: hypothetical protein CMI29_06740 [Opitutae bacterium]|nr:hypothetical protein [Opitutae bacterium]|tara:strand:+ start:3898 stop:4587 length:690 start_codon:yes stop_codon:yes gene_type:complete
MARIDLQASEIQDVLPRIFTCLLAKWTLVRIIERCKRPNNWSLVAWEPTENHPYDTHPIFTLRLVCKRFSSLFKCHVAMCCVPYTTRVLRYKGKKWQSEHNFVDHFFKLILVVLTDLRSHGLSVAMCTSFKMYMIDTWTKRVDWVVKNTDDQLASKLYHLLKAYAIRFLGDHKGKGSCGENAVMREYFFNFLAALARPLDKLAEERMYEFGKERKRRPISWHLQTYARF